ncbi:MAG: polyisoprenyl-phosphate glycosyltransferase [Nocardioidaceae bacterium]|jgi:glycosyltransferase involved in cell wall biosynthesis|nr:polyisoprenyl-phosphate glycosyltransferase [Nocardioidaceae bacterium]
MNDISSTQPDHAPLTPLAPLTAYHSPDEPLLDPHSFTYSIVVPVFNSAGQVGDTVDRIVSELEGQGLSYELILVNDGSSDGSWDVIAERARRNPHVVAVNLLRNYGQHNANLAGFREVTGDYVITMDDDLQNPPDQIRVLIDEAMKGRDVVFGAFESKKSAAYRKLGSSLIGRINRRVFGQPPDLVVSNFRILRRDVVDRICASRTAYPYITGQALMYSSNRSNVPVRHDPAKVGKSRYSTSRIVRLVLTILFSYTLFPLRLAAVGGFLFSILSFLIGGAYLIHGLTSNTAVPGWTTLVVLLAVFNGVTIALLSMLGEYVVRTLNAVSAEQTYHVVERVKR